jgi:DNA polymerase delta subunit 2
VTFIHWIGTTLAVAGRENAEGEFLVMDCCYPEVPQAPMPSGLDQQWVALVSGLDIGKDASFDMSYQLMVDYLTGELGNLNDQKDIAKISAVILAGNSLQKPTPIETEKTEARWSMLMVF